jgi:serine/threonine kinase 17
MEKWPSTQIKLCDFGLSRVLTNQRLLEMSGTTDFLGKNYSSILCLNFLFVFYSAPEVVNYEPLTCATDMWNIGVLIYVLVTGHTPFGGSTKLDTQSNITHCILDFPSDLFEKISQKCIDLIQKLIVRIPKHRATVHESLKHSWIGFNEEVTLTNDQLIEEEIDGLTNEIDAQNFN